jgi:hypothetical protein
MKIALALTLTAALVGLPAHAQNLALSIGDAPFEFHIDGCADLSGAQVNAVSSGIIGPVHHSGPLRIVPAQTKGIYELTPAQSVSEGVWIVVITATCQGDKAGAIVRVTGNGFIREGLQIFSRLPLPAEIDSALKAYASSVPSAQ